MMLLYQLDVVPQDFAEACTAWEEEHGFSLPEYAVMIAGKVVEELPAIDEILTRHLTEWTVERLGAVERTILRIAICEMSGDIVPAAVAIDEAVELAKRYASPEAAKLVNGILASYMREKEAVK